MAMSEFISSTLVTSRKVTSQLASRLGQEAESSSSGGARSSSRRLLKGEWAQCSWCGAELQMPLGIESSVPQSRPPWDRGPWLGGQLLWFPGDHLGFGPEFLSWDPPVLGGWPSGASPTSALLLDRAHSQTAGFGGSAEAVWRTPVSAGCFMGHPQAPPPPPKALLRASVGRAGLGKGRWSLSCRTSQGLYGSTAYHRTLS